MGLGEWPMLHGFPPLRHPPLTLPSMDPRNVAHDKTVAQVKKHKGTAPAEGAPHDQPGKKEKKKKKPGAPASAAPPQTSSLEDIIAAVAEAPPPRTSAELEGSLVVLAQLKDLAFHANAHQGRLAELMLTVEDKLKQKELAKTVGDLYSAQADLHTKLTAFIERYAAECERLQGVGS